MKVGVPRHGGKRIFTTSAVYVRVPLLSERLDLSQHRFVHQNRIRPCHVSGTQQDDVFWLIVQVDQGREMQKRGFRNRTISFNLDVIVEFSCLVLLLVSTGAKTFDVRTTLLA